MPTYTIADNECGRHFEKLSDLAVAHYVTRALITGKLSHLEIYRPIVPWREPEEIHCE